MTMPSAAAPATNFFTFLPDNLVLEYGDRLAIFLARMANWVRYKLTMEEVDSQATVWIYNRQDDWVENTFTFWTSKQVRCVLERALAVGAIKIRDDWDAQGVRTRYYAFADQDEMLEKTGAGKRLPKPAPKKPDKSSNCPNGQLVLEKQMPKRAVPINDQPNILKTKETGTKASERAHSIEIVDKSLPDNLILLPTPEAPTEKSEPADRANNNPWPKAPALPMKPSQLSPCGGEALSLNFEAPAVHLLPTDHLERYARLSQAVSPEFEDGVLAMRWAEHTAQNARRHQIVREYYALLIAEARLEMGWDHKTMALLFDFASTTQDEVLFGCTVTPYKLLSEWANGMTLLENLKAKFLASSKGKVLKKKANLKAALDALDTPQEIANDPYRI